LEVKIKTFPFLAFYFYLVLEIIIFYNFHESFYLGQKRGTRRQKKEEELWPPQPPVLWLRSPVLVMGLKGHVGKRRAKGLKSTVGITTLRRVVFTMRMYVSEPIPLLVEGSTLLHRRARGDNIGGE
jgi:hypothetical protein